MTLKELKEKIATSPNKEWLQAYELEISYPHINYKTTLKGAVNIYDFLTTQLDGYDTISDLPAVLQDIKKTFSKAKDNFIYLLTNNDDNKSTWDSNLRGIASNSVTPIFLTDSPELDFLLKTAREKNESLLGAYEYLIGVTTHVTNKKYFQGYLLAYEFTSKDFSLVTERKEAEKKSISTIRSNFQEKLGEAQTEVIEYIAKSDEKFKEYASQIDSLKNEKDTAFHDWFKKISEDFLQFNTTALKKVIDFEELYKDKLKLEAPAKYWNERAIKLRKEGNWWLRGLITCLIITIGILIWILNMTANGTLQDIFSKTSTAIKWSIVLVTLISFLAYGIRIFSKLTFSSFHLVRDAEEREQLTYVYLALQKEKGIDATERHLIMQSLFSRADSGLLKDDASPTMPGNIIDQVTKK